MYGPDVSVLVASGEPRHTIDIVRSLGRRRINVSIISKRAWPPARFSRYLASAIIHNYENSPLQDEVEFLESLVSKQHFDVVISAGLDGFRVLSYGRDRIERLTKVPVPSFDAFSIAEDKAASTRLAQSVGVQAPKTYYPRSGADLPNCSDLVFPLVIKARRGQGHYAYASKPEQLREVYRQICGRVPEQINDGLWPIIQEYIPGKTHGFYALMSHGELRACFMHERIHEVPPSGGPSSMAKSYFDEELMRCGTTILSALNWHGVAMVEFKKDARDGGFKLIEINPKFWGSLGLSISAGIDFPYLLIKMALEGDVGFSHPPANPVTYQWLSMDMAHSWAARKPWLWLGPVLRGVPNDFRLSDPLPSIALPIQGISKVMAGRRRLKTAGANQLESGATLNE